MKYSVDTSAIIETWVRGFPPDVFPALWKNLENLINEGSLIASEEVLVELEKKHDEAYRWACKNSKMFTPIDLEIQKAVREILREHKKLIDERKNRSGADPFVIALAMIKKIPVITEENINNSLNRPKIPDICQVYGIKWLNMLQFCREQGWRFN